MGKVHFLKDVNFPWSKRSEIPDLRLLSYSPQVTLLPHKIKQEANWQHGWFTFVTLANKLKQRITADSNQIK